MRGSAPAKRRRSTTVPTGARVPRFRERVPTRVLLDTHAFLWWIGGDARLSPAARKAIAASGAELVLSVVSAWEIAIKTALGRFSIAEDLEGFITEALEANRVVPLPVSMNHALYVSHLPNHHRDPFDRLLVAQSILENLPIVTGDRALAKYDIEVVW